MIDSILDLPSPDLGLGYTWRPLQRADAQALNNMLLEIEAVDQRGWITTLEDRLRDFEAPDTNPATDTILALSDSGQMAGMGWIFAPPDAYQEYVAYLWGEVHPAHRQRGLGSFILSWLEARGRQILATRPGDLPHYLRTSTRDVLADRVELIESQGFEAVRAGYRMRASLDRSTAGWTLPDGISLVSWDIERNPEALQVLNTSFQDHWGFVPMSEELWRLLLVGHPDFRPELSWMALAHDSSGATNLVGVSINFVHAEENLVLGIQEGWIAELAVLRPWRRQGIASALLSASMESFKAAGLDHAGLGVDTENLTGALRIYERAGFQPTRRTITYSKTV